MAKSGAAYEMHMKSILTKFKKGSIGRKLNSSQQYRKGSSSGSIDYCIRSRKESVNKGSTFMMYRFPRENLVAKRDYNPKSEVKKCSKFYINHGVDLPSVLFNQMRGYMPSREGRSVLRTPFTKGYDLFKAQIQRRKEREFNFTKRKFS
jgi:hypothetical protein